jgi:hypothetical protein
VDATEKKAAFAILRVFKERGVGEGGFMHFDDFGKVLRMEAGHVKHENQRVALQYLKDFGYVDELNTGLELTAKGAAALEKLKG